MTDKFWDNKIEAMPQDDLKELQLKRLKSMIDYVYRNNRFYRDRLKEAKLDFNWKTFDIPNGSDEIYLVFA